MVPDRASRESLKEIDIKKYHYFVHHILLLHFIVHHDGCQLILFTETIDQSFHNASPIQYPVVFFETTLKPKKIKHIYKHTFRLHNLKNIAEGTTDPGVDCFDQ